MCKRRAAKCAESTNYGVNAIRIDVPMDVAKLLLGFNEISACATLPEGFHRRRPQKTPS